jgi:hypothetical protein
MVTLALSIGLTEPIGEWSTLVNTIKTWCNRDDWSDVQVTEFIAIAEARFNRVLRVPDMEEVSANTLVAGNNDLPLDFLSMRAIHTADCALSAMSPVQLVQEYGAAVGAPAAYTLLDSGPRKIRLAPAPSVGIAVTMVYYKRIEGVNENNADNWLLNDHPDLYLWGCLLAAEAFLANDERLPLWKAAYDEALSELDAAGQRDRYGSKLTIQPNVKQVRGVRA